MGIKIKLLKILVPAVIIATTGGIMLSMVSCYSQAYEKTPAGVIEKKDIPESKMLVAETKGGYFNNANGLFSRLFKYINTNQVKMTVPVEADMEGDNSAMKFYVGPDDAKRDLKDQGEVKVVDTGKRTVISIGGRGSYSEENIKEAKDKLEKWLSEHPEYVKKGEAYAVFWNSPFMIWFMKRFELHVPVEENKGVKNEQ